MVRRQAFASLVLLIVIIFATGIIVGRSVSNPGLSEVSRIVRQGELATESYLIEQEILADFGKSCELAQHRLSGLSEELGKLGKRLDSPTASQDLGADNYGFLKRKFHLMQIKTYALYYRLRQDCNTELPVILFYYSRNDSVSTEQGIVLDRLVREKGINVFAIEYNYSQELSFLENYYSINATPAVVVQFGAVRQGLVQYDELAGLVSQQGG